MKRLFLSSMFSGVSDMLPEFDGTTRSGKRITFIPTAARPEKINFYVADGRKALERLGFIVDELDVADASAEDIAAKLRGNDAIYISGGNTFFLLQEMKRSGADRILAEEIEAGKLYIGESAGSILLSPDISYVKRMDSVTDAPELTSFDSIGAVKFSPLPHHTNFPFKSAVARILKEEGDKHTLVPFRNDQVILSDGDTYEIRTKST